MSRFDCPSAILAIRPAGPADRLDVARLAALDSASVPSGPLLLGILDGCTQVALSLTSGAVVADPFAPTAGLVALVRDRAARLEPGPHRHRPRWRAPRPAVARSL